MLLFLLTPLSEASLFDTQGCNVTLHTTEGKLAVSINLVRLAVVVSLNGD